MSPMVGLIWAEAIRNMAMACHSVIFNVLIVFGKHLAQVGQKGLVIAQRFSG